MEGYTKTSILARGTFGTVYLGHSLLKTRQQVVIKEIHLGTIAGQVDSSESQTEVKVLKLLCHPNIIKIYQATVHNDMLCMVSYGVDNFLPETIFSLNMTSFVGRIRMNILSTPKLVIMISTANVK